MIKGKIIVFSGPSGSGKTTLAKRVQKDLPNMVFSISATTREKRDNEKDGEDYYFLSTADFEKKIQEGAFLEYEKVWNNYYGTLKDKTALSLQAGKHVIFDVDVHGAMSIKKVYNQQSLLIFVKPPSMEVLEKRLRDRKTETKSTIKKRLERAKYELGFAPEYDRVFVNEDFEQVLSEIKKTILDFI